MILADSLRRVDDAGSALAETHGSGTEPGTLTHAFDRFWRSEESHTLPGHGLGLALVKQICGAHRGTVTIDSNVGVGTPPASNSPFSSSKTLTATRSHRGLTVRVIRW